jgi:hypothetical protein
MKAAQTLNGLSYVAAAADDDDEGANFEVISNNFQVLEIFAER